MSLATSLATVVFVSSPTADLMAQNGLKLPADVMARRAAAKQAQKKKKSSLKPAAKASGVQLYGY